MRRTALTLLLPLAIFSSVGCQQDFYARQILEHDTSYGKLMLAMAGDANWLIKQKRIDSHHRISTSDKTRIDVWVIKGKPPAGGGNGGSFQAPGTAVIIHGLLDSKASYLSLGERLSAMGYDAVLLDLRAHGASGGKYITWGAKEQTDVKQVMDTLTSGKVVSDKIYAFGSSLGASVAIQYAAIDPNVKGVMAMAPFKDITIVRRGLAILAPTMSDDYFNAVLARAGKLAGFRPSDASAADAAAKLGCPILLVHGLLDMTVPVANSEAIYQAAGEPKQIIIVPWASHATLLLAREAWIAEQIDNIARTGLKKPAPEPKQE
jgi:alpha-beta hydrolase superfamily lysophospholipase